MLYCLMNKIGHLSFSMDGFKVVKLEDICHFVDIVITCTGKSFESEACPLGSNSSYRHTT